MTLLARFFPFFLLLFSLGLVAFSRSTDSAFPDNLAGQYSAWDFKHRSSKLIGDIDWLERDLLARIRNTPQESQPRWLLFEFYLACGMTNQARSAGQAYRDLIETFSLAYRNSQDLWFKAAESHYLVGEFDKALHLYRKSLNLRPSSRAWQRVQALELRSGRLEEARAACRRWMTILKLDQHDREISYGNFLFSAGRPDEARAAFIRALGIKAESLAALSGLVRVPIEDRQLADYAVSGLKRASYRLDYFNPAIEALLEADRFLAALEFVRRAGDWYRPKKSIYWLMGLARVYQASSEPRQAAECFRLAREWRSQASEDERSYYLEREILCLSRTEDFPLALERFKTLFGELDSNAEFFCRLSLALASRLEPLEIESMVVQFLAGPRASWERANTANLERLDSFLGSEFLALKTRLWRAHLKKTSDPVAHYKAGLFYLKHGFYEFALRSLESAWSGLKAYGEISVPLAVTAAKLGLNDKARWHEARARYLLGHQAWTDQRACFLGEGARP